MDYIIDILPEDFIGTMLNVFRYKIKIVKYQLKNFNNYKT